MQKRQQGCNEGASDITRFYCLSNEPCQDWFSVVSSTVTVGCYSCSVFAYASRETLVQITANRIAAHLWIWSTPNPPCCFHYVSSATPACVLLSLHSSWRPSLCCTSTFDCDRRPCLTTLWACSEECPSSVGRTEIAIQYRQRCKDQSCPTQSEGNMYWHFWGAAVSCFRAVTLRCLVRRFFVVGPELCESLASVEQQRANRVVVEHFACLPQQSTRKTKMLAIWLSLTVPCDGRWPHVGNAKSL